MARYKLDIQKRQHRERSQPLNRQKLGLLEKHSDYVQRAKDYNSKKDRLKKLRLKASLKNQDEFYFKMINSKTVDGLHYNFNKSNPALDNQLVKLLKTQDFNYVKTCRSIEEKKVNKLKETLGSMVTRVDCEDSSARADLNLEVLNLLNEITSATGAKNLDSSYHANLPSNQEESVKIGKKIVFVDSVEAVKNFDPSTLEKKKPKKKIQPTNATPSTSADPSTLEKKELKKKIQPTNATPSTSAKKVTKNGESDNGVLKEGISKEGISEEGISKEGFLDEEDQFTKDQEAHMRKLLTELKSRLSRLRVLQTAERELELKKTLMGKGSKFLKFGSSGEKPKLKGLINGRDLSWYDKLDRNQLIEEDLERERAEKENAGIKTGAKVWKWKQERKK